MTLKEIALCQYIAAYIQEELHRSLPPEHIDARLISQAMDAFNGGAFDWDLFILQKLTLLRLVEDPRLNTQEVEALDGVINMMDFIQDEFQPHNTDKDSV